jgi:hypothetical protein
VRSGTGRSAGGGGRRRGAKKMVMFFRSSTVGSSAASLRLLGPLYMRPGPRPKSNELDDPRRA